MRLPSIVEYGLVRLLFVGVGEMEVWKTIVRVGRILVFPFVYIASGLTVSPGWFRLEHCWRWWVYPEGRLVVTPYEFWELRRSLPDFNHASTSTDVQYGCHCCFVTVNADNDDRLLLFKSEELKNWFILKYL